MRASLAVASLVVFAGAAARAEAPMAAAAGVATGVTAAEPSEPFAVPTGDRLDISVTHHFPLQQVIERVGHLLDYWRRRFDISSEWRGSRVFLSGRAYGIKIEAVFEVSATDVHGFAKDPGWPWRGQVSAYVDRKLKKYLHPTYDEP